MNFHSLQVISLPFWKGTSCTEALHRAYQLAMVDCSRLWYPTTSAAWTASRINHSQLQLATSSTCSGRAFCSRHFPRALRQTLVGTPRLQLRTLKPHCDGDARNMYWPCLIESSFARLVRVTAPWSCSILNLATPNAKASLLSCEGWGTRCMLHGLGNKWPWISKDRHTVSSSNEGWQELTLWPLS